MSKLPADLLIAPASISPVRFRLARDGDCAALHEACYPHRPFPQFHARFRQMIRWQENGRCVWLVATRYQVLVGSGQLIRSSHAAEIANLAVAPGYRGHGVGTALVERLTAVAQHLGHDSLEIGVDDENRRAASLYRRLGFDERRHLPLPNGRIVVIFGKTIHQQEE